MASVFVKSLSFLLMHKISLLIRFRQVIDLIIPKKLIKKDRKQKGEYEKIKA